MDDRHAPHIRLVERALLDVDGALDRKTRRAAAEGEELPGDLAALVNKIREAPSSVTDADVALLSKSGRSDDEVFELVIATAFGAAKHRFEAAQRVLAESRRTRKPSGGG